MLTVYLDQNHWIALDRARNRPVDHPEMARTLERSLSLVNEGRACFPVSALHIMELSKINDDSRRRSLKELFLQLGRGWVLPARSRELPSQIEYAVGCAFGKQASPVPRTAPVRGYFKAWPPGAEVELNSVAPNAWGFLETISDTPEGWDRFLEFGGDERRREAVRRMTAAADEQVDAMRRRRERVRGATGAERYRAYCATLFLELQGLYRQAMTALGIDPECLLSLDTAQALSLTENVPVLDCETQISVTLERQWPREYETNDVYDLGALFLAIPTCGVVFTERQWVGIVAQTRLSGKYGCKLHHDTRDLEAVLDSA